MVQNKPNSQIEANLSIKESFIYHFFNHLCTKYITTKNTIIMKKRTQAIVLYLLMILAINPVFAKDPLALPGKKGVCFTLQQKDLQKNLARINALKAEWNYSWNSYLVKDQPKGVEFIPMTWGAFSLPPQDLYNRLAPLIKKGKIKRLLSFNEPDGKEQANMSVEKVLELWPALEKLNIPLGSPGAVHPDKEWMQTFMKGVQEKNYRVDYICVHHYGGTSVQGFLNKLKRVYEMYKRPILITEFAVADWKARTPTENCHTDEQVQAFMKEILPALDKLPYVYGYAWFSFNRTSAPGTSSALFEEDGSLTPLGEIYAAHTSKR